jgi:hypothetical protein
MAPHPRQVTGNVDIGVPPLRWTYGDRLSNINSLIRTSLGVVNHAGANPLTFEPLAGRFLDRSGRVLDAHAIQRIGEEGSTREENAGLKTPRRGAVLHALLREPGTANAALAGDEMEYWIDFWYSRVNTLHPPTKFSTNEASQTV